MNNQSNDTMPKEGDQPAKVCYAFQARGRCNRGSTCLFLHSKLKIPKSKKFKKQVLEIIHEELSENISKKYIYERLVEKHDLELSNIYQRPIGLLIQKYKEKLKQQVLDILNEKTVNSKKEVRILLAQKRNVEPLSLLNKEKLMIDFIVDYMRNDEELKNKVFALLSTNLKERIRSLLEKKMDLDTKRIYKLTRYFLKVYKKKKVNEREEAAKEAALHPQDWVCAVCSMTNFAKRKRCHKCDRVKSVKPTLPEKNQDVKKTKKRKIQNSEKYILYVSQLPYSTTKESLRSFFEKKGAKPTKIRLLTDRQTGKKKGNGFVEFNSHLQMNTGITLHHTLFGKRRINVEQSFAGGEKGDFRKIKLQKLKAVQNEKGKKEIHDVIAGEISKAEIKHNAGDREYPISMKHFDARSIDALYTFPIDVAKKAITDYVDRVGYHKPENNSAYFMGMLSRIRKEISQGVYGQDQKSKR